MEQGLRAEPHRYLTAGRRVRIKGGPLAGLEGILLRWKGNWRVVLSLQLIQRSVSVDLDASDVGLASPAPQPSCGYGRT